ncbi:TPA: hypothetical protein ACYQO6_003375 [Escherichia coli]
MAIIVAYGHFFGETKLFMLSHYPDAFPYWLSKFYEFTETTPFVFTINGNFATIVFSSYLAQFFLAPSKQIEHL